mmetsp:Transcript_16638/g.35998  ORF Transcript_16638/g.35998 Transcript_16638/m.35998 type:complete len:572 (-) Transcript_16638:113-1828(-)|eukprot:CAMPEP_0202893132 /NCGR_PEP_ID=MMETSP1392-20130828/2762_1 /ASSEMBLY_ACC=CAM_ASM_000868 /TAXON_ID=225041 /ORGANISM="Chlamydomonas chlamydogama, Strain SAG 11-48b" /LENGTH=571 /DNA_ID=CAMNT_0049577341 /DNA_START=117 /DNA_END=1832 /DNA_ORIENTATION=+
MLRSCSTLVLTGARNLGLLRHGYALQHAAQYSYNSNQQGNYDWKQGVVTASGVAGGLAAAWALWTQPAQAKEEAKKTAVKSAAPAAPAPAAPAKGAKELPTFTAAEVAKHKDKSSGIWVTYQGHVYDITAFVDAHPGGMQKIMLAAGGSIEPFWAIYQQHQKAEVKEILAQYKIGKLAGGSGAAAGPAPVVQDAYAKDPARHPVLITRSARPYNSETPAAILAANLITPTDLFYIRNHLPVPEVDVKHYKLRIEGEGVCFREYSLEELMSRFKKHTLAATIQCSGNRRSEMKEVKPVKGLDWNAGAIGNATWGGVMLRDVLKEAGLSEEDARVAHIHFVGLDQDADTKEVYAASVPVEVAMNPAGDVLLAYEMNGEPLTRDHGYPLRVVVPGVAGARNVKWLSKIMTSPKESSSFWQQRDYKAFSPSVDWDNVQWDSAPAIQETPITAAVCEPESGAQISVADGEVTVRGYAWSGGGRDVIRVDLSLDGGKTWEATTLHKMPQKYNRAWAWTLWEGTLPLPKGVKAGSKLEIVSRAVDSHYNAQPDSVAGVWNLRGVVNNAWHRVKVDIVE